MKNKFAWLLAAFVAFIALLGVGLTLKPQEIPSPLIDRPAPDFRLARLEGQEAFSPAEMRGKVWLLNVWASWCDPCRQEHPVLVALGETGKAPIVGLNYKEVRGDAGIDISRMAAEVEDALVRERVSRWLAERGDPYLVSVLDIDGRVGIDYGVYGVPETYLIDKAGIIRFKYIGPITPEIVKEEFLPRIQELQGDPAAGNVSGKEAKS
ncbi:MAG: DsbE family thiol:disulfide interchange protein [Zoogloeaceae bacterium]|jgi:cytochrome c biogenesis protein CcmG/thiol:disulfide interchange protein DsbE|nr:DsbE family thiol:disulfide interchange protein [Zoogloeaceae bacterium]